MAKPKSLLQQAKEVKTRELSVSKHTEQEVEVAVAWLRGEITAKQVATVIKKNSQGAAVYVFLATALKRAHQDGWIS